MRRQPASYSYEDYYYDDKSGEMYELQPSVRHTSLYRGNAGAPRVGGPKSGVNIMADLAEHTPNRKNLLKTGSSGSGGYIDKDKAGLEVIMYPSGQLLKSSDPRAPASSTIGPRLESALLSSLYGGGGGGGLPHYVLAKSRRRSDEGEGQEVELGDGW